MAYVNLGANLSIQLFNVRVASLQPSTDNKSVTVNAVVTAPAGTYTAAVEYSTNDGKTFNTASILPGPAITVPVSGAVVTQLVWDAYTDMGSSLYNKQILVRVRISDGAHTSAYVSAYTRLENVVASKQYKAFDKIGSKEAVGTAAATDIRKLQK